MVSRETLLERYFSAGPNSTQQILRYEEILKTWGIERGLIGPREGEIIWERHILNCLPILSVIKEGSTLIDVGSGAGLPGIVLAISRPDLKVTLLEPLERRVKFLNEVVGELELSCRVVQSKAEKWKASSYQVVTARAVANTAKLFAMTKHLVAPGGAVLALKGSSAQEELVEAKKENVNLFRGWNAMIQLVESPDLEPANLLRITYTNNPA
jgi:16S rRNA (guanine527-N7)-methyltransferase